MKHIFEKQLELQRVIANKHGYLHPAFTYPTKGELVEHIKDHAFFLNEEVRELILAIGGNNSAIYKTWKVEHKKLAEEPASLDDNVKKEAIDVLCFAINICLMSGITADNVDTLFDEVYNNSLMRQKGDY